MQRDKIISTTPLPSHTDGWELTSGMRRADQRAEKEKESEGRECRWYSRNHETEKKEEG